MPLFRIRRDVPDWGQEQLEAAALRAAFCIHAFGGSIKWHRSYFNAEAGELHCFYEAPGPSEIEAHARIAQIPCDEVVEVSELLPDRFMQEAEAGAAGS